MKAPDNPANGNLRGWVAEHMHENFVLPNPSLADIRKLEPRVNFAVLQELARRADIGADPLEGMRDFYVGAISFRNPATRLARPAPERRR